MLTTIPDRSSRAAPPYHSRFFSAHKDHPTTEPQTFIQPRLKIGQPGTALEKEADAVADAVTAHSPMDIKITERHPSSLQRKCQACAQEEELHRKEQGSTEATSQSTDMIHEVIATGGYPLDNTIQREMSAKIGYDFSNVVLHTDQKAAESAQAVNARAYTLGNHLVFNKEEYNPHSTEGQHLLAHELTHVIQQNTTVMPMVQRAGYYDPEEPEPCDDMLRDIIALMKDVVRRFRDAERDFNNLFRNHHDLNNPHSSGSWVGHRNRYNEARTALRNKLLFWDINDECRNFELLPEEARQFSRAREYSEKEFPSKPNPDAPQGADPDLDFEPEPSQRLAEAPVLTSPTPAASPEMQQKVEQFLIDIGIPAFALAGMVALVIAALADPEPFSKVGLIIGTAAAAALLILLYDDASTATFETPVTSNYSAINGNVANA